MNGVYKWVAPSGGLNTYKQPGLLGRRKRKEKKQTKKKNNFKKLWEIGWSSFWQFHYNGVS